MAVSQNAPRGILLFLAATGGIVMMNTCVKMVSHVYNPIEMVFYRGVIALAVLVPYMGVTRSASVFKTRRIRVHLYRAVLGNIGVGLIFWAYALLPMADATSLLFAAPLFVTALSPFFLGENIDRYRWAAVIIGFGGILMIAKPTAGMFHNPASLVAVGGAFFGALVDITLRNLGRTDDPLTTVFYFLLIGVAVTAPYTLFTGTLPTMGLLPWVAGAGIFSAIQQVAKTKAFQIAEASLLAPCTYSAIIWATLTGWIFWNELPGLSVVAGTAVVVASNLAIAWRERHGHSGARILKGP